MKKLFYLFFLILVASCSDDVIETSGLDIESDSYRGQPRSHKVSEQQAINIIMAHFVSLKEEVYSRGSSDSIPGIHDIDVLTRGNLGIGASRDSSFWNDEPAQPDSLKNMDSILPEDYESIPIDTLFYVINFENDEGFAILAADDRTDPIYAIIDEGNFHPASMQNEQNSGFLGFLEGSIETLFNDVSNPQNVSRRYWQTYPTNPPLSDDAYENNTRKTIKVEPLLKTKWNQGNPYNAYCPDIYTGCVITATAQVMSYYQTFDKFEYNYNGTKQNITLDWNQILIDCSYDGKFHGQSPQNNSAKQVAWFMAYLGSALHASYNGLEGTSANSADAINWFNKNGKLKATTLRPFKDAPIYNALKSEKIVYVRGSTNKDSGGHAWVVDGMIANLFCDKLERLYVHCNWGWGGSRNGYFLSKVLQTSNAYIADPNSEYGNDEHFKYGIKYSIISNK